MSVIPFSTLIVHSPGFLNSQIIWCRYIHKNMVSFRPSVHCLHIGPSRGDMCSESALLLTNSVILSHWFFFASCLQLSRYSEQTSIHGDACCTQCKFLSLQPQLSIKWNTESNHRNHNTSCIPYYNHLCTLSSCHTHQITLCSFVALHLSIQCQHFCIF
jgi:hypothetical protein